jgi:hydroxylamine reductase
MSTIDIENFPMFCYQCEQTVKSVACTKVGVCSKNPVVSEKQDLITCGVKSLSFFFEEAKKLGATPSSEIPPLIAYSMFLTLTNTNFEPVHHDDCLSKLTGYVEDCKKLIAEKKGVSVDKLTFDNEYASWTTSWPSAQSRIDARQKRFGETLVGLHELITYGLKGLSAYAYHALHLNHAPVDVLADLTSILAWLSTNPTDVEEILQKAMKVGLMAHSTMKALDEANTTTFGHPEPTSVAWGPQPGKCIVVSGHDLHDLHQLLVQSEGKGINIYTHGEMLPCNAYPALKKFPHLVGHYGTAWMNQRKEFAAFPGPILMTTNCIMPPTEDYVERIWATGPVGFPRVKKIEANSFSYGTVLPKTDFTPIIEQALAMEGFPESVKETAAVAQDIKKSGSYPDPTKMRKITIGFAHNTVVPLIPHVVDSALKGHLKRVFVVGGCDGHEKERTYFTDFVSALPENTAVLTLACGKFRYNHLGLDQVKVPGTEIPRLMDVGQCNDGYSGIMIAAKLAEALKVQVHELPLSVCLSWFEQKAVADLLALLAVGVKNIKLGPRPPAFVTADALNVLTTRFGLTLTTTVENDLKEMLA